MLLGIDVGGTFTDAVVVEGSKILMQSKAQTTHDNLLDGILAALDKVLPAVDNRFIQRVALSTTIVTNTLVEGKIDKVGLCLMPGPGVNIAPLVPTQPFVLPGYIDHRGREIATPGKAEIEAACRELKDCEVYAVAGKFAVRNPKHELMVSGWIKEQTNTAHITMGSQIAGTLNFWRRANSAYYNAAVWRQFGSFAAAVEKAMMERGITAPVYILKADGGTMPLAVAKDMPVEAIFTGPAASALGIMALQAMNGSAVSLDIGGTTTDIALWQNGTPLFADKGAAIAGFPTAVRAFRLKSVGIGGDSFVRREEGKIKVGPMRRGSAMAVGGCCPTVSDAMIVAGDVHFGNFEWAAKAMGRLALPGQSLAATAQEVIREAAQVIKQAIDSLIIERAAEPVYRVEDVVHESLFVPETLIGVGGAAPGLAPAVAAFMKVPCLVPADAMVANAVGAAVARPTIDITLRADTAQGVYTVAELGIQNKLATRHFDMDDCYRLTSKYLNDRAAQAGIPVEDIETVQAESFNVIRGFRTTGKIVTCRMQVKPGVLTDIQQSFRRSGEYYE